MIKQVINYHYLIRENKEWNQQDRVEECTCRDKKRWPLNKRRFGNAGKQIIVIRQTHAKDKEKLNHINKKRVFLYILTRV